MKGVAGCRQRRLASASPRILKLSDELQRKVAAGEIPLRVVKALTQLEAIHPKLAATAATHDLTPGDAYEA